VIYLVPRLERGAWDIAVLVVAHELAHIVLGHSLWNDDETYEAQEEDIFRQLCKWGFEREAKRQRAGCKARDTREENAIEELRLRRKLTKKRAAPSRRFGEQNV
jgi:hypothetical protein